MKTFKFLAILTALVATAMLSAAATAQTNSGAGTSPNNAGGRWVNGPDGKRYFQPPMARVDVAPRHATRRAASLSTAADADRARVTLVGHTQTVADQEPARPLQQLSRTRQVGKRIEAASYVRPLGNEQDGAQAESSATNREATRGDVDDNRSNKATAPQRGPRLTPPGGEESPRFVDRMEERPAVSSGPSSKGESSAGESPSDWIRSIPELSDLPRAGQDPALELGRQALEESVVVESPTDALMGETPSASRIVSTWLPAPDAAAAAQWTQTQATPPSVTAPTVTPPSIAVTPSPQSAEAPTWPYATAWQGAEPADLAPRLPGNRQVAPPTGQPGTTMAPRAMMPSEVGPGSVPPTYSQPVLPSGLAGAPSCDSLALEPYAAYAPYAPAVAAPAPAIAAQPSMSVRRGLVGQPVIHMPGQPLRNFLRFVTP